MRIEIFHLQKYVFIKVKPHKVEEFEALMLEVKSFLENRRVVLLLRLIKEGIA